MSGRQKNKILAYQPDRRSKSLISDPGFEYQQGKILKLASGPEVHTHKRGGQLVWPAGALLPFGKTGLQTDSVT